jgi:hypothetical protein
MLMPSGGPGPHFKGTADRIFEGVSEYFHHNIDRQLAKGPVQ